MHYFLTFFLWIRVCLCCAHTDAEHLPASFVIKAMAGLTETELPDGASELHYLDSEVLYDQFVEGMARCADQRLLEAVDVSVEAAVAATAPFTEAATAAAAAGGDAASADTDAGGEATASAAPLR